MELQGALQDLRGAVQRPLGRRSPPTDARRSSTSCARLEREHAQLGLRLVSGDAAQVPAHLEPLVQSVLVEAIRNVQKHAAADRASTSRSRAPTARSS